MYGRNPHSTVTLLTGIMESEVSFPLGNKHAMSSYPGQVFSNHPHNLPPSNSNFIIFCY